MARPKKNVEATMQSSMESAMARQDSSSDVNYSGADANYGEEKAVTSVPSETISSENSNSKQDVTENVSRGTSSFESKPVESTSYFTDEELKAIDSGWTPKESFKGDPAKWRDAKAWNEGNRTLNIVEEQRRRMEQIEQRQNEMYQMMKEERAQAARMQITSLEKEKEDAIRSADVEKVRKIDDLITSLRGNISQTPAKPSVSVQNVDQKLQEMKQLPKEVEDFVNRNPWFKASDELSTKKRAYAVALGDELTKNNSSMNIGERMIYIENEVEKIFGNSKKNFAPVENRRNVNMTNSSNLPEYGSLPAEARSIIDEYGKNAEFYAKRNKQEFNLSTFRASYVRQLIKDGVLNQDGTINQYLTKGKK